MFVLVCNTNACKIAVLEETNMLIHELRDPISNLWLDMKMCHAVNQGNSITSTGTNSSVDAKKLAFDMHIDCCQISYITVDTVALSHWEIANL